MMNCVVIDNCVVFNFTGNKTCIRPISLAKKMNPKLNIASIPKITYGNRLKDNNILSRLSSGLLNVKDLKMV